MRGYDHSDKPATGYDLATLARDVRDLIDALGGPAFVAAHDWGGVVAYQIAMDWPDRIRRLLRDLPALGLRQALDRPHAPHPDAWVRAWLTHPEQQR